MHEDDGDFKGYDHNGAPSIGREGWVAISREMMEHYLVAAGQAVPPEDPTRGAYSRMESWIDLLMLAAFKERKITSHGATMILRPGQTMAGREWLAQRWNWSEKRVRVWLKKLETELMISLACEGLKSGQQKGHLPNVLTICNWGKYQMVQDGKGPPIGPPEGHPRATQGPPEGHTLTTKQLNKETRREEREEKKEVVSPALAGPSALDALRAFEAYNDLAQRVGLPLARSLTPQRRKAMVARFKEHGGPKAWDTVLANIARSAFLQGKNSRDWTPPGLDWFLNPSNFTKVLEGGYGNGAHAQPKETEWERMSRLMGEPTRITEDIEIIAPERPQ